MAVNPEPTSGDLVFRQALARRYQCEKQQGLGNPIISEDFQGQKFVAVGNKLYHSARWKTFFDFLWEFAIRVLTPEWFQAEKEKPESDQHPLFQLQQLAFKQLQARQSGGGLLNSAPTTGAIEQFFRLAYHLYLLSHNGGLPDVLLGRIKKKDQFRGAEHELYVAATFILAGFTIEFEDESDSRRSHCEYTVTHRRSGMKYSVEAKAKGGAPTPLVKSLLGNALSKQADHPRLIWFALNMPAADMVCHHHGSALWQSAVETINKPSVQKLVSGDEAYLMPSRKLQIGELDRGVLNYVAAGAHWLLNLNMRRPGPSALRSAYIEALHQHQLVRGDRVFIKEICQFVEKRIGPKLLTLWSSSVGNREHNWLSLILRASSSDRSSQAPLRHLMLMAALGHDARSFFASMAVPRLSGGEKMFIPVAKVKRQSVCEKRKDEIMLWWGDEDISVSEMARQLGVATDTVGLFAAKAGLPFPRKCKLGVIQRRLVRIRKPRKNLRDMRASYLRALVRYPLLSQTEIGDRTGGLVKWLQKHDALWLEAHRPIPRRRGGNPGIDWERRDQKCAELIPAILRRLQKRGDLVSLSSIGRELKLNLPDVYARLSKTRELCLPLLNLPLG